METVNFDDLQDLGTEARLAVALARSGATDSALGFLARRIRNEYGACATGLNTVIEEIKSQVPQCFHEEPADPLATQKAINAMPDGREETMAGLADFFRRRSEAKAAMARA